MTKEEVIKKAYGESWEILKDYINQNGFINCVKNRKLSLIPYFEVSQIEFKENEARPKVLKGIENNNGWVKIYCENDLPQFDCHCWFMNKRQRLVNGRFLVEGRIDFLMKNATHYKIVADPELPLY